MNSLQQEVRLKELHNRNTQILAKQLLAFRCECEPAEYMDLLLGLILLRSILSNASTKYSDEWNRLCSCQTQDELCKTLIGVKRFLLPDHPALKGLLSISCPDARLISVDVIRILNCLEEISNTRDLSLVFDTCLAALLPLAWPSASEHSTSNAIQQLICELMSHHRSGKIYDPCCGTGGLLINAKTSADSVEIYGQESNSVIRNYCAARMYIRNFKVDLGNRPADTLQEDLHPDLCADWVVANPPFNQENWLGSSQLEEEVIKFGLPPIKNANFAWLQHSLKHLNSSGTAIVVLANGSLNSASSAEQQIRKRLVEQNLVDCIISLPKASVGSARLNACIWILSNSRAENGDTRRRDNEILFIHASQQEILDEVTICRITEVYNSWAKSNAAYKDVAGLCKSARTEVVKTQGFKLTPALYVEPSKALDSVLEDSESVLKLHAGKLSDLFKESARLDREILNHFGYLLNG